METPLFEKLIGTWTLVELIEKVSLFPNWTGQTQNRIVIFRDGFLHLESEKSFISNFREVTHKLIWKKICS